MKKAYVCKEACKTCGSCIKFCKESAIKMHKDRYLIIDQSKCTGCGRCAAECTSCAIALR